MACTGTFPTFRDAVMGGGRAYNDTCLADPSSKNRLATWYCSASSKDSSVGGNKKTRRRRLRRQHQAKQDFAPTTTKRRQAKDDSLGAVSKRVKRLPQNSTTAVSPPPGLVPSLACQNGPKNHSFASSHRPPSTTTTSGWILSNTDSVVDIERWFDQDPPALVTQKESLAVAPLRLDHSYDNEAWPLPRSRNNNTPPDDQITATKRSAQDPWMWERHTRPRLDDVETTFRTLTIQSAVPTTLFPSEESFILANFCSPTSSNKTTATTMTEPLSCLGNVAPETTGALSPIGKVVKQPSAAKRPPARSTTTKLPTRSKREPFRKCSRTRQGRRCPNNQSHPIVDSPCWYGASCPLLRCGFQHPK